MTTLLNAIKMAIALVFNGQTNTFMTAVGQWGAVQAAISLRDSSSKTGHSAHGPIGFYVFLILDGSEGG